MSFPGMYAQRAWHLIDAKGQTVGRLANQIAQLLKGKHKPTFRREADIGDYVVVVNVEKVHFTGKKWKNKLYRWHTGYPGGLKQRTAKEMLERKPDGILWKAVMGMLCRNKLRHQKMQKRLKLYVGPDHPHKRQLPDDVEALDPVPRKLAHDFHFGLGSTYARPGSFQAKLRTHKRGQVPPGTEFDVIEKVWRTTKKVG